MFKLMVLCIRLIHGGNVANYASHLMMPLEHWTVKCVHRQVTVSHVFLISRLIEWRTSRQYKERLFVIVSLNILDRKHYYILDLH